jgi:hypothetical protein
VIRTSATRRKKVIDDATLKWLSQMETELKRKNGTFFFSNT